MPAPESAADHVQLDNGMEPWRLESPEERLAFAKEMRARGVVINRKENRGVTVREFIDNMGAVGQSDDDVTADVQDDFRPQGDGKP